MNPSGTLRRHPAGRSRPAALAATGLIGMAVAGVGAPGAAAAQATGEPPATVDIRGEVLDAATRVGIPDVILRVLGTDVSAATDRDGAFVLRAVPVGRWEVEVTHLRYGSTRHGIAVDAGVGLWLEVRVAEEAIELEALVVEAETAVQRERRTTGASFWEVTREQIEAAAGTSRHMGDLISKTVPGIRVRQSNNLSRTDICMEFRAAASISIVNARPCNHPAIYMDGVPITDPQFFYGTMGLDDIERIQVIPPGEAGTRYGSGSLYGVMLIETRRPGFDERAGVDRLAPGRPAVTFDWELDPAGHPTGRTILGGLAGNAVGMAIGVTLARQCIDVVDRQIRSSCGLGGTVGAGAAAVLFPAFGAALGARLAGSTERSQGTLIPALVGAGLMLFPGYAFSLSTVGEGSGTVNGVGYFLLGVGVPLAVTLADRLYRRLR
ncbi:MAG: TonB-dependent receptor plug domain-containing protein [Longimicrobiales bacterium]|nr:TonB-dependent receptor plug domain-containing protein [Longimicrobiales bacterium]